MTHPMAVGTTVQPRDLPDPLELEDLEPPTDRREMVQAIALCTFGIVAFAVSLLF